MKEKFIKIIQSKWALLFIISLQFALHLPYMHLAPRSIHLWRQCNTLAMARNFYEMEMNIFHPRVDHIKNTEGITGSQFPSYEFGLAGLYKLVGYSETIHRYYSFFIFCGIIICVYFLVKHMSKRSDYACIAAWTIGFSPELFYWAITALPDTLALCAGIVGVLFYFYWIEKRGWITFVLSAFCMALAGLTKLQFLAFGVLILVEFVIRLRRETNKLNFVLLHCIYALITVGLSLRWYAYANYLIRKSGLTDFGLELRPTDNWHDFIAILSKNIISDLPELLCNFASIVLVLLGLIHVLKNKKSKWFWHFVALCVTLFIYHIIELNQMRYHQYYMLMYLLPLCILSVAGSAFLLQKNKIYLLILLIALQPILAYARIIPARWSKGKEGTFYAFRDANTRHELTNKIKQLEGKIIVGEDISGCIMFYFTHAKGYCFQTANDVEKLLESPNIISDTKALLTTKDNPKLSYIESKLQPKKSKGYDDLILLEY